MGAYTLETSDLKDRGKLLQAKLAKGAFVLSDKTNQPLISGIDVNSPTLAEELEKIGRRIPYDTFNIAFNHVTGLTRQDAIDIATAITGSPITSVMVRGKCFSDAAFVIDFVANLPATVVTLIVVDGALTPAITADFIAAVLRTHITSLNLGSNSLGSKVISSFADSVGSPITKLFLEGNGVSLEVASTVTTVLRAKGVQVSCIAASHMFRSSALSSAVATAVLPSFSSADYAYARLLALELISNGFVFAQTVLDNVRDARAGTRVITYASSGDVSALLKPLECFFNPTKQKVGFDSIRKAVHHLAITEEIKPAVIIAVFTVLNNDIPFSLLQLTAARDEYTRFKEAAEAERLAAKVTAKLAVVSISAPSTVSATVTAADVVIREAIEARRALLIAMHIDAARIETAIEAQTRQFNIWASTGRINDVAAQGKEDVTNRIARFGI